MLMYGNENDGLYFQELMCAGCQIKEKSAEPFKKKTIESQHHIIIKLIIIFLCSNRQEKSCDCAVSKLIVWFCKSLDLELTIVL